MSSAERERDRAYVCEFLLDTISVLRLRFTSEGEWTDTGLSTTECKKGEGRKC